MNKDKNQNLGMPETEVTALREALFAQQDLLQKLYHELDVERDAASSAASEALSMILRLQGEKAAIQMEANQYRRLAEEKMCHSEEALAIFEDLIYEKEMEIVSLVDEMETGRNFRRNSLPPIPFKVSYKKKGSVKRERSPSPDLILTTEENKNTETNNVEKFVENFPSGDISSYWEEIKKLGEQVREIPDFKGAKSKSFALGSDTDHVARTKSPPTEHPQISSEKEKSLNPSSSFNVYDVFEVRCVQESQKGYVAPAKLKLPKAKSVSQMAVKPYSEDENDSVRRMFSTKQREKTFLGGAENHSKFHWVSRMSEIVEAEGREGNYRERGREELKLLKEIQEQLNLIQLDIRSMKTEKCPPSYELPLLSLSEEHEVELVKELQENLSSIQYDIGAGKLEDAYKIELPLL